jgi:hypothetical protein
VDHGRSAIDVRIVDPSPPSPAARVLLCVRGALAAVVRLVLVSAPNDDMRPGRDVWGVPVARADEQPEPILSPPSRAARSRAPRPAVLPPSAVGATSRC